MRNELIETMAEILEIPTDKIELKSNFREFENWNSLASMALSAAINDEYDLVIPRVEFERLLTVNELIEYIESHK